MSGQLSNSAAVFKIQVTSSRLGIVNPTNRHFQFRHFIVHFICIPLQGIFNMLIRVHEESFVLFFFNSFILLDKKPFLIAVFLVVSALLAFILMGNKLVKGNEIQM